MSDEEEAPWLAGDAGSSHYKTWSLTDDASDAAAGATSADVVAADAVDNEQAVFTGIPLEDAERTRSQLNALLDSPHPVLRRTLLETLIKKEGECRALIRYVSRSCGTATGPDEHDKTLATSVVRDHGSVPSAAMRRSYQVIRVLTQNAATSGELIDVHIGAIVGELFSVFDSDAHGSFAHFQALLSHLLKHFGEETAKALLAQKRRTLSRMTHFLHEAPVMQALVDVLGCACGRKRQRWLVECFTFADQNVIRRIAYAILKPEYENVSRALFDALQRIVESYDLWSIFHLEVEGTDGILEGVAEGDEALRWLGELMHAVATDTPAGAHEQQVTALEAIALVLDASCGPAPSGVQTAPAGTNRLPPPRPELPPISALGHARLFDVLLQEMPELCRRLNTFAPSRMETIKLSAYSVPSFSTLRMALVCLVSSLTRFIERALTSAQATQLLDALPQSIWKMLSSLFIDYRHNNLYQAQFYRIFRFALRAGHLPTLRPLLSKSKLVSRMISAYTDAEPSSGRGFILLMCNVLRLSAEQEPADGYVRGVLERTQGWSDFEPRLRDETMRTMAYDRSKLRGTLDAKPATVHVGPGDAVLPIVVTDETDVDDPVGVHSHFAQCLGVGKRPLSKEEVLGELMAAETKAEEESVEGGPCTGEGVTNRKKKKRKKNRKKKGGDASNGNDNDDDDNDDDDNNDA